MTKLQKQLVLGAVVILLGVFSWWFLKYVFYVGDLSLGCWISGIILLIVWGIALCLAMLLIDDKRVLYGSFVLTLIAFCMFFNNEPFYYFIVLVLLFLSFWRACIKVRKEEHIQINLDFWKIWKRGLPLLVTGLILVVAMIYYFSPSLMEMKQIELSISQNNFKLVIKPLERLIGEKLPEGMTLDTDVNMFLGKEELKELEKNYGIKVEKGDTGKDVLYKLVNYQLNNVTGPYRKFIPLGLAIGLFIVLKIVSIIYVALVILLSWLILKILTAVKFVRLEKETKEVETVKL